jgi:dGTPase
MKSLKERLKQANALLAPYAVPHQSPLGRVHPEAADATRFPFQRDRDRIIHTQAFRRLKHKTQVFVAGHGDHYRTRITHTLEVAQISRDIARTLGLNEDLAESIALAHDLGHTPFGHAGEEAMRACMKQYKKSFEHNEQSLRIVTLLESRTAKYAGLNLSIEILEGLMKHRTPHDNPSISTPRSPSLEAQIVNLADEIAYTAHDTDDGLRAGQFSMNGVSKTALGKLAFHQSSQKNTELRGAIVDLLVSDLYKETARLLNSKKIKTVDDVYAASSPLVTFSAPMKKALAQHRKFLWNNLYLSPSVQRQAKRGQKIIARLFHFYEKQPSRKIQDLQRKTNGALAEAIKDYIAGMTDQYAIESLHALL